MKKFGKIGILMVLLLVFGSVSFANAMTEELPKGIWVTGSAVIEKEPDQTTISFSIVTTGKTPSAAQNENAQISSKISERFLSEGLERGQWKTVRMDLIPQYESSRVKGYQMTHQMSLTLADTNRAGKIVNILVDHEVNKIDSIVFGLKDPKAAEYEAIAQATKDAKQKGETLAKAAGARVSGVSFIGPPYAVYQPQMYMNRAMKAVAAEDERIEQQIWASTIEVTARIQICLDIVE